MTATGYTLVVPPRWMHIPGMAALASVLPADAIADAPELGAWAESFEAGLRAARAADPGGTVLDTYVHLGTFPGTVVDASVVVARIDLEPDAAADVEQLLVFRGAREDARVVDVAGVAGVVWTLAEHDADELAAVAPDGRVLGRRTALVPAPGWTPAAPAVLSLLMTVVVPATADDATVAASRSVAAALEELFDAMLGTVRWTDPSDTPIPVQHDSAGGS